MKRIFSLLCLFLVIATVTAFAKDSETVNKMAPRLPIQPVLLTNPNLENQLKMKEFELKKREAAVNNTASNSGEAKRLFEQKVTEAKKQRVTCLQEKSGDLRALEQQKKASVSALQASCSPKTIQTTLTKPTKPALDGMTSEEKQAAMQAFQQSMKEFYAQVQSSVKDCRTKVQQVQLEFREKMINLKEQCANTERSVLGLSTEVPYNQ